VNTLRRARAVFKSYGLVCLRDTVLLAQPPIEDQAIASKIRVDL
jgi:hypothetical protein